MVDSGVSTSRLPYSVRSVRRFVVGASCLGGPPSPPNHGKVGEAAVSTYFRRLKTNFYMGISRFLLGKRPVFFLVGFQNRYRPISSTDIDRYLQYRHGIFRRNCRKWSFCQLCDKHLHDGAQRPATTGSPKRNGPKATELFT